MIKKLRHMKSFIADKNRKLTKLALYHIPDLTFSALMKALRKKDVKVNGKRISQDVNLSIGDRVDIFYDAKITKMYDVIYQDQNVLVVNKYSGFTSEIVFEQIKEQYQNASFIHRLDRNTSGIMIFSLSSLATGELLKGFKERTFSKIYTATVVGKMPKKQDVLTAYLVKDQESALVKIYDNKIKGSVLIKTGYEVLEQRKDTSLLSVTLYTGKTHQIRAHLAHIGNPILGDGKYGDFDMNNKYNAKTQYLNATKLTLNFEKTSPLYYLNGKSFCTQGE